MFKKNKQKIMTLIVSLTLCFIGQIKATSTKNNDSLDLEQLQKLPKAVLRTIHAHYVKRQSVVTYKNIKKIPFDTLVEHASPNSKKILKVSTDKDVRIILNQIDANTPAIWKLHNHRPVARKLPFVGGSFQNKDKKRRSLRFEKVPFKELTNIDCENEIKKNREKENHNNNLNNKKRAQEHQLKLRIEETLTKRPYATRKSTQEIVPLNTGFQNICEKIISFRNSPVFKIVKGLIPKREAVVEKFYEHMPPNNHPNLVYKLIKSTHYNVERERSFYVFRDDVIHLLDLKDEKGRTNHQRLAKGLNFKDMHWHHIGQGITSQEIILLLSKEIHQDQYNGLHFSKTDSFVPRDGFNIDKKIMNKYLGEILK